MLLWVGESFARKGHEVVIYTISSSQRMRHLAPSCVFIDFEEKSKYNYKRTFHSFKNIFIKLEREIKNFQPDVILSFGDPAFYHGFLLKYFNKYKFIISERVDPYTNRSRNDVMRRKLYNLCDGAVFQTEKAQAFFSKQLQERSVVIPNPVKIKSDIIWQRKNTEEAVCFFGRFDMFQKRLDILLEAFAMTHQVFPDLRLDIYGSGNNSEEQRLIEMAEKLGIQDNVVFKGVSNHVLEDMRRYKALVFTSDYEGIPNIIIEAMSIGMPIVATDCSPGGAALLLNGGKNGILVERRNPQKISEGIIRMLMYPDLAEEYGYNAYNSLDRFDENVIADLWEEYFKYMIGEENGFKNKNQ